MKKTYIVAFTSFVVGVLLGIGGGFFGGLAYSGKRVADGLALMKEMEITESGQRAFAAYLHESPQVAIYSMSQYLDALKKLDAMGGSNRVIMTKSVINLESMLAHARLAKAYSAAGQTDRSADHLAEALRSASRDENFSGITNEAALMDIVARIDKGAKK